MATPVPTQRQNQNANIHRAQARMHAYNGDWDAFGASVAETARQNFHYIDAQDWMTELWFEMALMHKEDLLLGYSQWVMTQRSLTSYRLPDLSALIETAVGHSQMAWIGELMPFKEIWLETTPVPVPNKQWRTAHLPKGLQPGEDLFPAYKRWMHLQESHVQEAQQEYLARFGARDMYRKPMLYYAIVAYGEPTVEQTIAAATASNPVYDMHRLEAICPGFAHVRTIYEGMGMKGTVLRDALGPVLRGEIKAPEYLVPANGFVAA